MTALGGGGRTEVCRTYLGKAEKVWNVRSPTPFLPHFYPTNGGPLPSGTYIASSEKGGLYFAFLRCVTLFAK